MTENRNKLPVSVLIDKFKSAVNSERIKLIIDSSNPLKLDFDGTIYDVFLRNVSHGGGNYPENTTRVQLPNIDEFNNIKQSNDRFLLLGYANDSDVFVCWDPTKVKRRLNYKSYVSFFSRKSVQDSAEDGEIVQATLSNGDIFVAFKRHDFEAFLNVIEYYFPSLAKSNENSDLELSTPINKVNVSQKDDVVGILVKIEDDPSVKLLIDTLVDNESTLAIIAKCMEKYGEFYPNMQFKDWGKTIRKYLSNVI
jgi:hypothetical protein